MTTRSLPDFVLSLAAVFQQEARFMAPMLGQRRQFDASEAASLLDWRPRPSKQTVIDCAQSMRHNGLIQSCTVRIRAFLDSVLLA